MRQARYVYRFFQTPVDILAALGRCVQENLPSFFFRSSWQSFVEDIVVQLVQFFGIQIETEIVAKYLPNSCAFLYSSSPRRSIPLNLPSVFFNLINYFTCE